MKTQTKAGSASNFPFDLPDMFIATIGDRQASTYILDGNGEIGVGVAIDTSTAKMVKRVSNVMVMNETIGRWEVKQIRYLQGCPTIWVDEQELMKFKVSNPAASAIWFEQGNLSFTVQGYNIQKAMFLMLHENNGSFAGNEKFQRPEGATDVFTVIDTQRNAQKDVEEFDFDLEARLYIKGLKKTATNGQTTYNTDRLEFLAQLFKLPRFESEVNGAFGAETFSALIAQVNESPTKFIQTIGRYEAVVEADVNRAFGAGVLATDELGASFVQTGHVFLTFDRPRMTDGEKRKAVLDYMLNPANRLTYDNLRGLAVAQLKSDAGIVA